MVSRYNRLMHSVPAFKIGMVPSFAFLHFGGFIKLACQAVSIENAVKHATKSHKIV